MPGSYGCSDRALCCSFVMDKQYVKPVIAGNVTELAVVVRFRDQDMPYLKIVVTAYIQL